MSLAYCHVPSRLRQWLLIFTEVGEHDVHGSLSRMAQDQQRVCDSLIVISRAARSFQEHKDLLISPLE